jgi:hypothetical protein
VRKREGGRNKRGLALLALEEAEVGPTERGLSVVVVVKACVREQL